MPQQVDIDALGLRCPLPVLRIRKLMRRLAPGDVLRVTSDDPTALIDIPHYCNEHGHKLIEQSGESDRQVFVIVKN